MGLCAMNRTYRPCGGFPRSCWEKMGMWRGTLYAIAAIWGLGGVVVGVANVNATMPILIDTRRLLHMPQAAVWISYAV